MAVEQSDMGKPKQKASRKLLTHFVYEKRCPGLKCALKKIDNYSKQKLFKLPKGLAVCESQAASPCALPL